jgi:hypothetical protein
MPIVTCIAHSSENGMKTTLKRPKLAPFLNAKVTIGNARTFIHTQKREVLLHAAQDTLGLPHHELVDQSKTRFLIFGDGAASMMDQLPCVVNAIRQLLSTGNEDAKVRARGTALVTRLTSASFVLCLAIEAMVVSRINIMNRQFQGPLINFSSYRLELNGCLEALMAMVAADAPMRWLQFRVDNTPLGGCVKLGPADYALGSKRTANFVDAIGEDLRERVKPLKMLCKFDVLDPAKMDADDEDFGVEEITDLFNFFITPREGNRLLPKALRQWDRLKDAWPDFIDRFHPHGAVEVMEILLRESRYEDLTVIRDLCVIALSQPLSNAIVEALFSLMRLIKNYRSNAMLDSTMDDVFEVLENGPPEMKVMVLLVAEDVLV